VGGQDSPEPLQGLEVKPLGSTMDMTRDVDRGNPVEKLFFGRVTSWQVQEIRYVGTNLVIGKFNSTVDV